MKIRLSCRKNYWVYQRARQRNHASLCFFSWMFLLCLSDSICVCVSFVISSWLSEASLVFGHHTLRIHGNYSTIFVFFFFFCYCYMVIKFSFFLMDESFSALSFCIWRISCLYSVISQSLFLQLSISLLQTRLSVTIILNAC